MRASWRLVWWVALVPALAGCSKKQEVAPAPIGGETPKAGAMLAYEHQLRIELPSAQIPARLTAAREACDSARFGACNVLRLEQGEHGGRLVVRVIPAGVEPLSALAAQGGTVASRETKAEDLAQAVHDNQQQLKQLDDYAHRLDELAQRKDLAVADLISLSHERAQVQTQQDALRNEAATQQRRIDTNVLDLRFNDPDAETRSRRFGITLGHLLDQLMDGVGDALSLLAYGVPFLLLALPVGLAWRWAWRRITRRSRKDAAP